MNTKEIEIRFRIEKPQKEFLIKQLSELGWSYNKNSQYDTYFCDKEYIDKKDTKNAPYVLRVRVSESNKEIAYKSFTGSGSWIEIESGIDNPDAIKDILFHINQLPYLEIRKHRLSGVINMFEVNVDTIDNLGSFMEIEIKTDDEDEGKRKIIEFATQLGVPEHNIIHRGYVQLMEDTQNNQ